MIFREDEITFEKVSEGVERKVIARGGQIMAVKVAFKKGAVGSLHSHPHEQISYVIEGSFEYQIKDEKNVLMAGDSCYVEPDISHGVVALQDSIILDVFTPQRDDFLKKL
jgi:quercetin dioxygenase-like cupin family protein